MPANPNQWANLMARLGSGSRAAPASLAGIASRAGHAAHQAAEEARRSREFINTQRGLANWTDEGNRRRQTQRRVLPPRFSPIPDDLEEQAVAEVVPTGGSSLAQFAQSLDGRLDQGDLPEDERRRLSACGQLLVCALDDRVPKAKQGRAALVVAKLAEQGAKGVPSSPWVAWYMYLTATVRGETEQGNAGQRRITDRHPDLVEPFGRALGMTFAEQNLVGPGTYQITQANNNVTPLTHRFVLEPGGSLNGTTLGFGAAGATSSRGIPNPMEWARAMASQFMQGTQFTGKWRYEVKRPDPRGARQRLLCLDLWQRAAVPMLGTVEHDSNLDLDLIGFDGRRFVAYSERDGGLYYVQRES